jgi:cobyrinic acid a,c-diamide synthase
VGLIIAAPASGSGKTVFTLALLRLLARQGIAVRSAKVGPDYIDPAFHAHASGAAAVNLDPWAMRPATVAALLSRLAGAGPVVCEGVMGLFDGATATAGSTADVAALTGWPVVLVVDVRAQAASAAAVIRGFATHRADVRIAGVVFNRVGSPRHEAMLRDACRQALPTLPILGALPRSPDLMLPERHLGLVQADEIPDLEPFLDRAARLVSRHVATGRLVALACPAAAPIAAADATAEAAAPAPLPPLGQRIAVADDVAFRFRYPHVVAGWQAAGAEIRPFSPLADETPGDDADAVYLPGGYPELHAGRLAGNGRFLAGLARARDRGAAVFGECGGYMVLGEALIDAGGHAHRMAGLLPLVSSFADRRLHLGYRQAMLAAASPLGPAGACFRGHEFHYARIVDEGAGQPLFRCRDAGGRDLGGAGRIIGPVAGSFVHLIDSAPASG